MTVENNATRSTGARYRAGCVRNRKRKCGSQMVSKERIWYAMEDRSSLLCGERIFDESVTASYRKV